VIEQKGHRLSVVNAADGFGQQWGDGERPELGAVAEEEEKKNSVNVRNFRNFRDGRRE